MLKDRGLTLLARDVYVMGKRTDGTDLPPSFPLRPSVKDCAILLGLHPAALGQRAVQEGWTKLRDDWSAKVAAEIQTAELKAIARESIANRRKTTAVAGKYLAQAEKIVDAGPTPKEALMGVNILKAAIQSSQIGSGDGDDTTGLQLKTEDWLAMRIARTSTSGPTFIEMLQRRTTSGKSG